MPSAWCLTPSSCCSAGGVEKGRLLDRAAASGASVHVLEPVAPELVEAYAASADIGVSPIVASCLNYRYSLPNKLFQYMAAGIPVVASDFRQVRDVVEGSGAGVVVDTTRPEAIARAIGRILADPDRGRRNGGARAGGGGRSVQLVDTPPPSCARSTTRSDAPTFPARRCESPTPDRVGSRQNDLDFSSVS